MGEYLLIEISKRATLPSMLVRAKMVLDWSDQQTSVMDLNLNILEGRCPPNSRNTSSFMNKTDKSRSSDASKSN